MIMIGMTTILIIDMTIMIIYMTIMIIYMIIVMIIFIKGIISPVSVCNFLPQGLVALEQALRKENEFY